MKTHLKIFLISIFIFSCSKDKNMSQNMNDTKDNIQTETFVELSQDQYDLAKIELGKIEIKQINESIQVNGILDVPPQNLVSISVTMGGTIQKSDLLQGMKVRKNQPIALIKNIEFMTLQQDYLDVKNKVEFLKTDFEREKTLMENNINSIKNYQQALADYQSSRAKLQTLSKKLKLLNINTNNLTPENITEIITIYSPINGFVTDVNFNIGSYVNPQDVLFKIVDTEHIHAELNVFEKDVSKLKKGMKVRFSLSNNPNEERFATVFLVNHKIETDRTVRVHAHLDKEDHKLIPGMYLTAFIDTQTKNQIAVLDNSIVSYGGKDYIFLANVKIQKVGKTVYLFKSIEVKKGNSQNGFTAVETYEKVSLDKNNLVINGSFDLISKVFNNED
ncbi:MAG: efflux RND transporter periplasmic adaptor subunit [Cytophagales bacterium]|nr:MAG: efflux RND transporter periplasmic adaptor subunit [Cytophagales bacterium]